MQAYTKYNIASGRGGKEEKLIYNVLIIPRVLSPVVAALRSRAHNGDLTITGHFGFVFEYTSRRVILRLS